MIKKTSKCQKCSRTVKAESTTPGEMVRFVTFQCECGNRWSEQWEMVWGGKWERSAPMV